MKENYESIMSEVLNHLNQKGKVVFASCAGENVSARTVSIILINGMIYFQSSINMKKAKQVLSNPKSSVCCDNISIEGNCRILGSPLDNDWFIRVYKERYFSAYQRYSGLEAERIFEFEPYFIKVWKYEDNKPYSIRINVREKSLTVVAEEVSGDGETTDVL